MYFVVTDCIYFIVADCSRVVVDVIYYYSLAKAGKGYCAGLPRCLAVSLVRCAVRSDLICAAAAAQFRGHCRGGAIGARGRGGEIPRPRKSPRKTTSLILNFLPL
jgi:hypothetical protein